MIRNKVVRVRNRFKDTTVEAKRTRQMAFLQLIRGVPGHKLPLSVRAACDAIDISRITYDYWRQTDPEFVAMCSGAMEDGTDLIEDEAVRRAVEGVAEPIYQGGELVGHKQVYSDRMLELMLAGRRPHRYGRGGQVNVQVNNQQGEVGDEQLARALALMMAEAKVQQRQIEAVDASR